MGNKICPKCKKMYNEESAISRIDNKTEICPRCGDLEAVEWCLNKDKATEPTYYIKFIVIVESIGAFDIGIVETTRLQTVIDLHQLGFSTVISMVVPKNENNVPILKEDEWRKYARDFVKHSGLRRID